MGTLHRGLIVALKFQQQSRACSINTSTIYRLTQSGFTDMLISINLMESWSFHCYKIMDPCSLSLW
jgi:hypothetical protein